MTRFQVDQFLQGKARGLIIGGYRVREPIGAGGMALVYLGEDPKTRQLVALKLLPPSAAADEESLRRFQREARACAALDHPNIVRAFAVGQEGKVHYLVMEFVDGKTLHEVVQAEGPLEIHRACDFARQAALGLQHAHEAGLIHRDIKPGNLIVDARGTVKILDLGLARFLGEAEGGGSEEVLTKGVIGTPDYLAPEQTRDSHGVDIRADIYGLGGSLYFALTGRPPFGEEGTAARKLQWQLTHDPYPIHMFRPEVPEELVAILGKMLAKDLRQRYQKPAEVAEALEPWTHPEAVTESGRPRRARGSQSNRENISASPLTPRKPTPAPRSIHRPQRSAAAEVRLSDESAPAARGPFSGPAPAGRKMPAPATARQAKKGNGLVLLVILIVILAAAGAGWWFFLRPG